jgi:hypothetical protein
MKELNKYLSHNQSNHLLFLTLRKIKTHKMSINQIQKQINFIAK